MAPCPMYTPAPRIPPKGVPGEGSLTWVRSCQNSRKQAIRSPRVPSCNPTRCEAAGGGKEETQGPKRPALTRSATETIAKGTSPRASASDPQNHSSQRQGLQRTAEPWESQGALSLECDGLANQWTGGWRTAAPGWTFCAAKEAQQSCIGRKDGRRNTRCEHSSGMGDTVGLGGPRVAHWAVKCCQLPKSYSAQLGGGRPTKISTGRQQGRGKCRSSGRPWPRLHGPSGCYMGPHGCSSTRIVTISSPRLLPGPTEGHQELWNRSPFQPCASSSGKSHQNRAVGCSSKQNVTHTHTHSLSLSLSLSDCLCTARSMGAIEECGAS